MSTTRFEIDGTAVLLARAELLAGIEAEAGRIRRGLYDQFGLAEEPWADKATRAYAAMTQVGGFVASVGDQLSAELDILNEPSLYASLGGFEVHRITQGLGTWWSPSATWFNLGAYVISAGTISDPAGDNFGAVAPLLLAAGARALTAFYGRVAWGTAQRLGAERAIRGNRMERKRSALLAEIMRNRGMLFRDGPGEDGRYLSGEEVSPSEFAEALSESRRAQSAATTF